MNDVRKMGRVTIPTDMDAVPETLDLLKRLGADAIRDCDGTEFPQELKDTGAKIYATYYTTRKDNAWAKANPDETQQCYIMTPFYTAADDALTIPLMTGISRELMMVNDHDDITRLWEVIDRTTGEPVPTADWHYDAASESVVIDAPAAYHEYTVSFLAYLIWDPVHMYNSVINDWKDVEHQIPFDVRQPKTHAYTLRRLREYLESHPYVNVVRFTTFFHLFTLVFDELRREKYVDWYGYSASVSPYILEQFEKEVGYKFRPEFIIDQGYYNNQYRVPSKEYKDFQAFQRREVAGLMKEMTDIVHAYAKEAMMFLGDHWIGCEPFMPEFQKSGVDAIVGSVGNGSTLRLISDIPGVKYTEGRFLPYFFPDTFHEGGDPVREAKENWVTARRAILRKPIDRIGYGGYLKLACEFPEFLDYVESVCNEFRELYENIKGTTPYCVKTVAVLNSWGQQRAWGCHMVHHALYQKQNYSYAGVIEALSGAPFDVKFISFDDIKVDPKVLDSIDVLINVGDGDTAHTGGKVWEDPEISSAVKGFVHRGGGLIGGVAFAVKQINPNCKVYGVQAAGAPSMQNALKVGKTEALASVSTMADGIAVKQPGDLTFAMCQKYVDGVVTVTEDEIASAILKLIEKHKMVAEGAGAVSVAAAMYNKVDIKGKKAVCVISGGNVDVNVLDRIIDKALQANGRITKLSVMVMDKPGQLTQLLTAIAETGANIFSVNHDRMVQDIAVSTCIVDIVAETRNKEHSEQMIEAIKAKGFQVL